MVAQGTVLGSTRDGSVAQGTVLCVFKVFLQLRSLSPKDKGRFSVLNADSGVKKITKDFLKE